MDVEIMGYFERKGNGWGIISSFDHADRLPGNADQSAHVALIDVVPCAELLQSVVQRHEDASFANIGCQNDNYRCHNNNI